ncbi:saccharopine dehydrogenase [Algimonas arctica]|uniref:Saccharopine dehydrogenase n=1 Tax=Algimonas arctica TaxID=1479486 RepID=A0A8J3CP13_9PROT|nr:saccharopine dehydrogenase NADP-binding domain-containing protein [Algimonas arctica]GHA85509.1 saccharopine dehydrogenase [Algimonas arctica]
MVNPSFDIIVFGATSFVGQIMTRYMSTQFADGSVRWAIAGRSESKLQTLSDDVGLTNIDMIVADATDDAALQAMCARTKVVISTVGPYALYGDALVKACAESGTHYCDLSGEPQWIRKMQSQYEETAQKSGALIVHCCGFDSIPSDLGVHFLQQNAKKSHGQTLGRINMRVVKMKGGPSGGTVASIINMVKEAAGDPDLRKQLKDPYSLCPPDHDFSSRQPDVKVAYDDDYGSWIAPFVMAAINTRIVHRSNALSDAGYGSDFLYEEAVVTGKGGRGKRMARASAWGMGGFMVALVVPPVRWALEKFVLPKPGEGPSEKAQLEGEFNLLFMGETDAGEMMKARVTGDRDPGYGSTAKMLAQAAACLAQDIPDGTQGGFWTPATLMGDALIARLRDHAGLTFEME